VRKDARRRIVMWVYGGSLVLHVALALGARMLPSEQKAESVAIELADIRKKNEKPKPPPPPPPPPPKEKPKPPPPPPPSHDRAKLAPEPAKAEAPPPEALGSDGFADLGSVALGNGGGGGGDGVAIAGPARSSAALAAASHAAKATTRKVQQLAPAAADVCTEPMVKPRHTATVKPVYTLQARQAEIEGVVRVEVTVDESGNVLSARVLSGLGYGLDEAALTAARGWRFQPAMRCGKPLVGTTIIPFRFDLT
jgi:periplasmic protein TonB